MAKKASKKELKEEEKINCSDNFCPFHGSKKLKTRGRVFEGEVIRIFPLRVTISFDRMVKSPKYERYEKRKTKIHARLPPCIGGGLKIGDRIEVSETRPISKMIHFVATRVIKKKEEKNESSK